MRALEPPLRRQLAPAVRQHLGATQADLQHDLLPAVVPEVDDLELTQRIAFLGEMGGDYYDFFPLPGGRWGIPIADVSGHGTPAAEPPTSALRTRRRVGSPGRFRRHGTPGRRGLLAAGDALAAIGAFVAVVWFRRLVPIPFTEGVLPEGKVSLEPWPWLAVVALAALAAQAFAGTWSEPLAALRDEPLYGEVAVGIEAPIYLEVP